MFDHGIASASFDVQCLSACWRLSSCIIIQTLLPYLEVPVQTIEEALLYFGQSHSFPTALKSPQSTYMP